MNTHALRRCGGQLQCGDIGYQNAGCSPSACETTIFVPDYEARQYQPQEHFVNPVPDGAGLLSPSDLSICPHPPGAVKRP